MKVKEVYTGNIAISLVILLLFYLTKNWLFFWISICILVINLLSLKLASHFALILKGLYKFIGLLNSTIILILFYLLILTPISFCVQLFSKSKNNTLTSNWKEVSKKYNFSELW